jgi:hypothetical protein
MAHASPFHIDIHVSHKPLHIWLSVFFRFLSVLFDLRLEYETQRIQENPFFDSKKIVTKRMGVERQAKTGNEIKAVSHLQKRQK